MRHTKYFLYTHLCLYFLVCSEYIIVSADAYRVWKRKKRNIKEKREPATKNSFRFFWVLFFSRSADSEQALLGPYDSNAFVHCARVDRAGGSERTPCGAFCVCRHNQQYFECFLCKVRRFFLSVSLAVPVVFRLLFLQSDAECGTAAIFRACFNDSWSSFVNFWSTLLGAAWKLRAKSGG